ncbi:glycoside hydrolase family 15 protein [Paraburkholderia fungorum]|jgi:GH15 family glucan-1,4-alpha-glucosidase|uniref:Glycoside hydrolase family 15 protein n=1 Tax=Paraburkholderia fungorum TaxID=134537 RepID=A0AAP5Q501_9BURK|nr:glycoside hydrolase family 15 protein [Paraburkholderia fungorum]MDT8835837.1 glycoside hydrolase family 15 protein [Paraburkholderia fungorum]
MVTHEASFFALPCATGSAGNRSVVPIRDYAIIGNCHGVGLVSRYGSVDWCTLTRFDGAPVCWRLLDATLGGYFEIRPTKSAHATRRYLQDTNVLQTTFSTDQGGIDLTDFMPIRAAASGVCLEAATLQTEARLVRIVEVTRGEVELQIQFEPGASGLFPAVDGSGASNCEAVLSSDCGLSGTWVSGTLRLGAGDRCCFVLSTQPVDPCSVADAGQLLDATISYWQKWVGRSRYDGPYHAAVHRSALLLKLLTYEPTGAIVAAPTTSLPEEIGGTRNWDYRFCWLRDSRLVLSALATLGYHEDASRFCDFQRARCSSAPPELQILTGIDGSAALTEKTLDHVSGYCGSRPVRIGNAASAQRQADIYGEVLEWLAVLRELTGRWDKVQLELVRRIANQVAGHWQEPDQGLWEMRCEPRHHIHSKLMSWVALDRALGLAGENSCWRHERDAILAAILVRGTHPRGHHLVHAFGFDVTDASLLLAPTLGIPLDRGLVSRTVAAVRAELACGDYVRRYRADDGLPGTEGAFLMCSFWLVDALLFSGEADQARLLFERLLDTGNDVGLYAEEIDPDTGDFLGNFPQGYTHLALINSAVNLSLYARGGNDALRGTLAQRLSRAMAGRPSATGCPVGDV